MLKKTDLLMLLTELQDNGENVDKYITSLYKTTNIPLDIIKYINDKRPLDVAQFYEKLRHNYNHKKSDLYINIVKETEDIQEVLTTLAAYNLQVLLFGRKLKDPEMFYRNSRVEEVTRVLNNYYKTFDIHSCNVLLSLIKADIKLFEEVKN